MDSVENENVNSEIDVSKKQEKVKTWLKDKHNFAFLGVLVLALVVRLYYFVLTKGQALWWDEADYLAYAKNLAGFDVSWIVTNAHNSLFPYLVSGLFKLGMGEVATKFILILVPSFLLVVLTYKLGVLMYKDKTIALISSFLMAVFWAVLFNSMRFHLGIPALFFGLLAVYVYWQGYERKEKIFGKIDSKWAIPLTVVFVLLTYAIRRGYFLFGIFFFVYMLLTRNWKSLYKDKYNWVGLGIFGIFFFVIESTIFVAGVGDLSGQFYHGERAVSFEAIRVFSSYFLLQGGILHSLLFYVFWFGLAIITLNVFVSFDHLRKTSGSGEGRADLFNLLSILITLSLFVFVLREQTFGEPRWYFSLLFASFVCVSRGVVVVRNSLKRYNKMIVFVLISLLVLTGGYAQMQFGGKVIEGRTSSYAGIKDAGLFLKGISNQGDVILSGPRPQTAYYAERSVVHPGLWTGWAENHEGAEKFEVPMEVLFEKLEENPEVRYLLISFSEPNYPSWMKRVSTSNGQIVVWEIPFMDTSINFMTGEQNLVQEKSFGGLTFRLIDVKQDVFIYEIERN